MQPDFFMHSQSSVRDDYKSFSINLGSRNGAVRDVSYATATQRLEEMAPRRAHASLVGPSTTKTPEDRQSQQHPTAPLHVRQHRSNIRCTASSGMLIDRLFRAAAC